MKEGKKSIRKLLAMLVLTSMMPQQLFTAVVSASDLGELESGYLEDDTSFVENAGAGVESGLTEEDYNTDINIDQTVPADDTGFVDADLVQDEVLEENSTSENSSGDLSSEMISESENQEMTESEPELFDESYDQSSYLEDTDELTDITDEDNVSEDVLQPSASEEEASVPQNNPDDSDAAQVTGEGPTDSVTNEESLGMASADAEVSASEPDEEVWLDQIGDTDQLFERYVNQLFYGSPMRFRSAYISLDENSQIVYAYVCDAVKAIASGDTVSSVITVPLSAFGYTTETGEDE